MCKIWMQDDREPLKKGTKIYFGDVSGRCFIITEECGRGNSRIVYYAKDDKDRKVLIKELYPIGMSTSLRQKATVRFSKHFLTSQMKRFVSLLHHGTALIVWTVSTNLFSK